MEATCEERRGVGGWKGRRGVMRKESYWKLAVGHPLRKWGGAGQWKKACFSRPHSWRLPSQRNQLDECVNAPGLHESMRELSKSEDPAMKSLCSCIPGSSAFGFYCVWPMILWSPFFSRMRSMPSNTLGAVIQVSFLLPIYSREASKKRTTRCWVPKRQTFISPEPQWALEIRVLRKKKENERNWKIFKSLFLKKGRCPTQWQEPSGESVQKTGWELLVLRNEFYTGWLWGSQLSSRFVFTAKSRFSSTLRETLSRGIVTTSDLQASSCKNK